MSKDHRPTLAPWFVYRALTADELRSFADNGYLLYGPSLTDAGLERMRDECMAAWNAEKGPFDPDSTWLNNALLSNIHHRTELVRQYYFSGPIVDVATQIIGPNIKTATSQLTFKMRGNTQSFAWHQDNVYGELEPYNAISCLTALDDADQKNGCIWLVPGSHTQGQVEYERTDEDMQQRTVVELDIDDALGVPVPIKAGQCLFFHALMLHKSEGNFAKDRDRRILFLRYADADAVEVYNDRTPRLGRLVRGNTKYNEVRAYEAQLPLV